MARLVTDFIEWVSLILGAVGAAGVLILVHQWFVDTLSHRPYRLYLPWGMQTTTENRVGLSVWLTNRRSSAAEFWAFIGRPELRPDGGSANHGFILHRVRSSPSHSEVELDTLRVEPHSTRTFFITAEVPAHMGWPSIAQLYIHDGRNWSRSITLWMPRERPVPGRSAPMVPLNYRC